ncbi:MAG: alpha/beta fold hydrolase [Thermoleophilaceae bacterium]
MAPKTQYARCGDISLAYQVVGDGDIDIVLVPSFVSHIEFFWAHPAIKSFLDRIASFARLVIFDKAGTGLSDPVPKYRTLEERATEVEAVMDAAGMDRAVVFGLSEGGPTAIFFSVTRPARTEALVLFGTFASSFGLSLDAVEMELPALMEMLRRRAEEHGLADDEIPDESQIERVRRFARHVLNDWGEGKALKELVPGQGDEAQLGLIERLCTSPGMARATLLSGSRLDVIEILGAVAVPTLVVHARGDLVPVQGARLIARRIPGARLLEVEGVDHAPWFSSPDEIVGEIEELLTGTRHAPEPDRILATVLFTDIVGSTERATELGDARWRAVLERHDQVTRARVADAGGVTVKSTGDGYLATFNGPAAAIRCAESIREALASDGLQIRAGLHTGEIERIGEDIGGVAVHIAARVCANAGSSEILVSRTIGDLVVGSGLAFEDRGSHVLKGVPGEWQLLAVAPKDSPAADDEKQLAEIEIGSARAIQRPTDRLTAAVARRAPGAIRAAIRLDPRYRRAVRGR